MRVLLIKTSSMGDLIHTFPALTDAGKAITNIKFDWLVEPGFADIPRWHPLVENVIPVPLRKWRKNIVASDTRQEIQQLRQQLHTQQYDVILDAQTLVKSALLTFLAKGERVGLDFRSAREPLASFAYQRKCKVNFYQHAIVRMRELFSQALYYPLMNTAPEFGLSIPCHPRESGDPFISQENYLVFLPGTTWTTKKWPEQYWIELAKLVNDAGYRVKISGGNTDEIAQAKRIADACENVDALPRLNITEMANLMVNAKSVVAVDTGFGHLAAALNVPTVSLYGPTNPDYTGALGTHSLHIKANFPCAPCLKHTCSYKKKSLVTPACFATITPLSVAERIKTLLS